MKKIIILILLTLSSLCGQAQIKSASYWTAPTMTLNQAKELSRFNLLILDFENMFNNHQVLDSIKKWNPKILLLAYSNPMEIFTENVQNRPLQQAWRDSILKNYPQWILKTNLGNKIVFYSGMKVMNLSSTCPEIKGQNYEEFMDSLLLKNVLSDSIWSGYFMDNGSPNISWLMTGKEGIDADNNGQIDNPVLLDQAWSKGIHSFLLKIRKIKGKDFILIANKGVPVFMDVLDGRMFENFPNNYLGDKTDKGWWQNMANAHQTGNFTIFQVKEKNLKFAIASALLLQHTVYIAVDQNNDYLYPQLKNSLELGGIIKIKRSFSNGLIQISPQEGKGEIFYKEK